MRLMMWHWDSRRVEGFCMGFTDGGAGQVDEVQVTV